MVDFVPSKQHLREALLFCFNLKKSAAESHRLLVKAYGEYALSETSCRDWFRKFKNNDFVLKDQQRPGQPKKFEEEELEALLDADPCQTLRELTETLNVDRYRQQLINLKRELQNKRPEYAKRHDKVIFQHDNARPHIAQTVKDTLKAFRWDVLPHPPYSPDIAPSDYHLFRSMQHGLSEQRFTSYEDIKKWLDEWIASKEEEFFYRGIHLLPEKWEKVVNNFGNYCE